MFVRYHALPYKCSKYMEVLSVNFQQLMHTETRNRFMETKYALSCELFLPISIDFAKSECNFEAAPICVFLLHQTGLQIL